MQVQVGESQIYSHLCELTKINVLVILTEISLSPDYKTKDCVFIPVTYHYNTCLSP